MKTVMAIAVFLSCIQLNAQHYSPANAHSHNDYEQAIPFYAAWKAGFGSIEADIFLKNGKLIVAHDTVELKKGRTLDSMYLQPLQNAITANNGSVYADPQQELILLVDVKTAVEETLEKLVEKLNAYPLLTHTRSLKIAISGNRPEATNFHVWPKWMLFDGNMKTKYNRRELKRVALFSDNFATWSKWKGQNELAAHDRMVIDSLVQSVHKLHKKIRLWNAPDIASSWKTFMDLHLDYINTDHIEALSRFMKERE
jgi:alkaline phosphatase